MRIIWLDVLKGIAIVMVVAYHLLFDLDQFVGLPIDTTAWYWAVLALPVLVIFVGGAGISLVFSYAQNPYRVFLQKTIKNTAYLLICAGAVTITTWYLFPDDVILFGVLHLIAVSRLLGMLFVGAPVVALLMGGLIFFATPVISNIPVATRLFVWLGCAPDNFSSLDYFPLFPWFGIFCIGMLFGHLLLRYGRRQEKSRDKKSRGPVTRACAFLGRHTLVIYLFHQPLIISILWLCGLMRL